jgi:hypothetical protein
MAGSQSDPVRLDPFQTITEVAWASDTLLSITYDWLGSGMRDLDTVTGVGSFEPIGYGYGFDVYDGDKAVVSWGGDTTGYNGSETIDVWGRHIRKYTGSRIISVRCAAHWYPEDQGPAPVALTIDSYTGVKYPDTTGKLKQTFTRTLTISAHFDSPQSMATVEFDTLKGTFTVS